MEDLMTRINMETLCKARGETINAEINHNGGEFKVWRGKTEDDFVFMRKDEEGIWMYNIDSWNLKVDGKRFVAKGQNPVFLPIGTENYEKANRAYIGGTN